MPLHFRGQRKYVFLTVGVLTLAVGAIAFWLFGTSPGPRAGGIAKAPEPNVAAERNADEKPSEAKGSEGLEPVEDQAADEPPQKLPDLNAALRSAHARNKASDVSSELAVVAAEPPIAAVRHSSELPPMQSSPLSSGRLGEKLTIFNGKDFGGRGVGRNILSRQSGGTAESAQAVEAALEWLAAHQFADGSWSFNHGAAPQCQMRCRNPGIFTDSRNAATGLALLAYLGAGETHHDGKYKNAVKQGLAYLTSQIKRGGSGGSLHERRGRMYSHGIASIAICEAYAMTHDRALMKPAQDVINFICYAQDPQGGGWRYEPRETGDTSVTGWQLMALKSGAMAGLKTAPNVFQKTTSFLNSVQKDYGANYGYTEPGDGRFGGGGSTAIGLLCRMYMGWKKDNPALKRGVTFLSDKGPSLAGDIYYNFYATQVLRHWEGDEWKKWNDVLRDHLVAKQSKAGHEGGSWYFDKGDEGAIAGGRLYDTAMCALTLEVYYRHMPLYDREDPLLAPVVSKPAEPKLEGPSDKKEIKDEPQDEPKDEMKDEPSKEDSPPSRKEAKEADAKTAKKSVED